MKEYHEHKHKHILPWYCWCTDSDNVHRTIIYSHKDKVNKKIYKKRARRKAKKIIIEYSE